MCWILLKNLNVCTAYNINGRETDKVPFQLMQSDIVPEYKHFEGWNCDSTNIKNGKNLPARCSIILNL